METIVKAISNEFMCRARQWRDVADFEQSGINYPLIEYRSFHHFERKFWANKNCSSMHFLVRSINRFLEYTSDWNLDLSKLKDLWVGFLRLSNITSKPDSIKNGFSRNKTRESETNLSEGIGSCDSCGPHDVGILGPIWGLSQKWRDAVIISSRSNNSNHNSWLLIYE